MAKEERFQDHELNVIRALNKACKLSADGWTDAYSVATFSDPKLVGKFGGLVVAPTLTMLRGWDKPLVEARDSNYGKEYRLTRRGQRVRKNKSLS